MNKLLEGYTWSNYPTFVEDKNPFRQAYNRLVISKNISESLGNDAVEDYLKQFTEEAKTKMLVMGAFVKQNGYEEAIKTINSSEV